MNFKNDLITVPHFHVLFCLSQNFVYYTSVLAWTEV